MVVDKQDQGRALILDNLLKDSNGELHSHIQHHRAAGRNLHRAHRGRCHRTRARAGGWVTLDALSAVVAQGRMAAYYDATRGERAAHSDQYRSATLSDNEHLGIERVVQGKQAPRQQPADAGAPDAPACRTEPERGESRRRPCSTVARLAPRVRKSHSHRTLIAGRLPRPPAARRCPHAA